MFIIGYPTSILEILKNRHEFDDAYNQSIIDYQFWLFFFGIHKDQHNVWYFYVTFISLITGSVIEKQCINWLTNRFGCTYYRLQKYIELDMRREGLRSKNNWEVNNPKYDIERYRKHYFYSDFEFLKSKFEKNSEENDFIPHKVAVRIKDTIKFSVMLDSGAPGVGDDVQTQKLIK